MSAHWIASRGDNGGPLVLPDDATADAYRNGGWDVTGPFVPAEQLRGAVQTLDAIRDAVAEVGNGTHETPWNSAALVKFAKATRNLLGGQ